MSEVQESLSGERLVAPVVLSAQQSQPLWRKYSKYSILVDHEQDDKGKEIMLCSLARPHMRAFHCAWWAFFIAFFVWFAAVPILGNIKDDLGLTRDEVWWSSIAGISGTALVRIVLGPLVDVYGPRVWMSVILCVSAIPAACIGMVQTAQGLIWLRLCIGVAGGSFVMVEFWSSRMFTKEIVGTANALVAGWGNLGAGVSTLLIGSVLFPIIKAMTGGDEEATWRTVCIIPAAIAFATGIIIYFVSDDTPKGNFDELKKHGVFPKEITLSNSFWAAALDRNTWILAVQYGCCFGVELTMNYVSTLYFRDEFGQSTEAANSITAIFGWLNLFARSLGGFASDAANWKWGMRGRIVAHTVILFCEGIMIFIFSGCHTLAGAILALVFFSLFVSASEGATYGIVPYVAPRHMGSVTALVGAGGNVGAIAFMFCFKDLPYHDAFSIMGGTILLSCILSAFISIKGYSGLFVGRDQRVDRETGEIIARTKGDGSTGQGSSEASPMV